MKKLILILLFILPLLLFSCSGSNNEAELKNQLEIAEKKNQELKLEKELELVKEQNRLLIQETEVKAKVEAEAKSNIVHDVVPKKVLQSVEQVSTEIITQSKPTIKLESCDSLFQNSKEIDAREFFIELRDQLEKTNKIEKYSYISPEGNIARNGSFSTWVYEMLLDNSKEYKPAQFSKIKFGDVEVTLDNYLEYKNKLCNAYQNQKSNGTLRNLIINISELLNYRNDWPGHASKWEAFPYIETGPKVITSPSPKGLEFYTKYITGGGVIIVSGSKVDDGALLQARKSVVYMTSKIPDIRKILKDNEVRISLFTSYAGSLPEYKGEDEPGGFAMGMDDASMTANADWLCRPGNYDKGGDPVIHELVHTINHVVFEQINETYFYERIYKIAENSISNGIFETNFSQNLEDGQSQNMSHYIGEFWAMTVEGYIMDKDDFKNPPYDRRESIKKVDPELYDLIIRYFPIDKWDFCK